MKKLDCKGNAAILLCLMMAALCGFAAFSVDIGLVYIEKTKLSHGLDAAVLAGALELPEHDTKAQAVAMEYLQKNAVGSEGITVAISSDKKKIHIAGVKNVKHYFAPIIGIKSSVVSASAEAVIGPVGSVTRGVRPFAVQMFNYTYGDLVTLKEDAGDGQTGNYKSIALGGQGSSVFKMNALYGYEGTLKVGSYIDTEPGNMAGVSSAIKSYINIEASSYQNFPRNSIRLWTIPLVDTFQISGRGGLEIAGFASFYVEDIKEKAGKIEIQGRFVRFVSNAEIDMNLQETGLYGVKLSE